MVLLLSKQNERVCKKYEKLTDTIGIQLQQTENKNNEGFFITSNTRFNKYITIEI